MLVAWYLSAIAKCHVGGRSGKFSRVLGYVGWVVVTYRTNASTTPAHQTIAASPSGAGMNRVAAIV